MKRRMILILCFALLLSLAVFAVAEAAGGQYATSLLAYFATTTPENALYAPDQQLAVTDAGGGGMLVGMGKRVCGPLFVYGPAGGTGGVAVFAQADPMSATPSFAPVATGQLGAYDATRGRYTVNLFVWDDANSTQTTKRYTGNFQSLAVGGDPLSVDAVGATVCQNGQGQNQNGQGQNGQGQNWWNQNWQGQDEP